jgi:hypothetical protein
MEPSRYFVRRAGELPVEAPIETEASPVFLDESQPLVDFTAYWRTLSASIIVWSSRYSQASSL